MEIFNLFGTSWCSNCYILVDSGHAAIIDPSVSTKGIIDFLREHSLTPDFIILTHGHFDHVMSLDTLRSALSIPAYIHEDDAELLPDGDKNAFSTFFGMDRAFGKADKTLRGGDTLTLGGSTLEIISTPGHTDGSICIKCGDILVTGDTLFAESYGRCDLYSGDIRKMRQSLASLRQLDKNIAIYPGHGNPTRLGHALDNAQYM